MVPFSVFRATVSPKPLDLRTLNLLSKPPPPPVNSLNSLTPNPQTLRRVASTTEPQTFRIPARLKTAQGPSPQLLSQCLGLSPQVLFQPGRGYDVPEVQEAFVLKGRGSRFWVVGCGVWVCILGSGVYG